MTKMLEALPVHTYAGFQKLHDHMNKALWDAKLGPCLITLRSAARSYGYFHTGRFARVGGKGKFIAEIAMNPTHFAERTAEEVASTFVHEMAHQWQSEYGKEPTRCYHDRPWANEMLRIGLHPSDTGAPGGKETGPRVSHYIVKGGLFQKAFKAYLKENAMLLYQDRLAMERAAARRGKGKGGSGGEEGEGEEGEPKSKGRIKFTCKGCDLNAWAKPSAKLRCIPCDRPLRATEAATVGGDDADD